MSKVPVFTRLWYSDKTQTWYHMYLEENGVFEPHEMHYCAPYVISHAYEVLGTKSYVR